MKRKFRKSNDAVSEVVGIALLLAITVSLFSLLSFVVLSYPFTPSRPSINLAGYIQGNNVTIEHFGGESLDGSTIVIIRENDTITKINIVDLDFQSGENETYLKDENNNGFWDLGERVLYDIGNVSGKQIEVTVVDISSNSIIMSGILLKEETL